LALITCRTNLSYINKLFHAVVNTSELHWSPKKNDALPLKSKRVTILYGRPIKTVNIKTRRSVGSYKSVLTLTINALIPSAIKSGAGPMNSFDITVFPFERSNDAFYDFYLIKKIPITMKFVSSIEGIYLTNIVLYVSSEEIRSFIRLLKMYDGVIVSKECFNIIPRPYLISSNSSAIHNLNISRYNKQTYAHSVANINGAIVRASLAAAIIDGVDSSIYKGNNFSHTNNCKLEEFSIISNGYLINESKKNVICSPFSSGLSNRDHSSDNYISKRCSVTDLLNRDISKFISLSQAYQVKFRLTIKCAIKKVSSQTDMISVQVSPTSVGFYDIMVVYSLESNRVCAYADLISGPSCGERAEIPDHGLRETIRHPHVSVDNEVCLGSYEGALKSYCATGDIFSMMSLLSEVMNTYNKDSGYINPEQYYSVETICSLWCKTLSSAAFSNKVVALKNDIVKIRSSKLISMGKFVSNGILFNVKNLVGAINYVSDFCSDEGIDNTTEIAASLKYSFFYGVKEPEIIFAINDLMSSLFNHADLVKLEKDLKDVYNKQYPKPLNVNINEPILARFIEMHQQAQVVDAQVGDAQVGDAQVGDANYVGYAWHEVENRHQQVIADPIDVNLGVFEIRDVEPRF